MSTLKLGGGGGGKVLLCLEGEGEASDPQFTYFVAPLPVINDQSLSVKGYQMRSLPPPPP